MAQSSTRTPPVILIAETRPTVAAGLKVFLSDLPDVQPVAIMTGFDHVVDYAGRHEIGLIIVGQGMDWAAPLSEFRRLREKNPRWRLALLVDVEDHEAAMAGLSEGASGIIPTSIERPELLAAVSRIMAGSPSPTMTAPLAQQRRAWSSRAAAPRRDPPLTPRQLEVLGILAQGSSNKQIAEVLAISVSTVCMHLNAAFHALGVHNRTSAALAYSNMSGSDYERAYSAKKNEVKRRFEHQMLN